MAVLKYKNPNWDGTTESEEYLTLPLGGGGSSFDDAPSDNNNYVRSNGNWVFDYNGYTHEGDYPSETATINGVNYTFRTGNIVKSTNKGLIIKLDNLWYDLGIEYKVTLIPDSNTIHSGYTRYVINPNSIETYFDHMYSTSWWNYKINDSFITKKTTTSSQSTSDSEDALTRTQTNTYTVEAYTYENYYRMWTLTKTVVKTFTRETTDDSFGDADSETITYSGYEYKYYSISDVITQAQKAYNLANTAYSAAMSAEDRASTAYSKATTNANSISSIQSTISSLPTADNLKSISSTRRTGVSESTSLSIGDYALEYIYFEGSGSITISFSTANNVLGYRNPSTSIIIYNSTDSDATFSYAIPSTWTILGTTIRNVPAKGYLELNFLWDTVNEVYYIRFLE